MEEHSTLEEKILQLPTNPGVYQYKNSEGKIIYVGKAKNIRNRVKQYFTSNRIVDAKTKVLVSKICDVEVIVTDSEAEALLLENNLIKQHKPKYNILLKDDKSYPYIRVTNEQYPRVFPTRTVVKDGSRYFGPYTDSKYMYFLLKTIKSIFPIRSCDLPLNENSIRDGKFNSCLDFHIHKCEAPCIANVSRQHYFEHIEQTQKVLSGKTKEVELFLNEKMQNSAENLQFEQAAEFRNKLLRLQEFVSKQKVMSTDSINRDVFALSRDDNTACTVIFNIRDGKLIGKHHYYATNILMQYDSEILQSSVEKWYSQALEIPEEILTQSELEEEQFIKEILEQKSSRSIEFSVPKIGDKKKLINLAVANAEYLLRELQLTQAKREQQVPRLVASLQRDLRLEKVPKRIECFDNSHLQGTDYVSSMVVFVDGKPKKSEYRKYKVKSFVGNDDFAAMREVISRRYSRMLEEKSEQPDLIVIDGGKGQLSSAVEIMRDLGIYGTIPVIGLAKRLEEVFFPEQSDSVLLPRTSGSLRLIQSLRDEAHRFAITFHRELRSKRTLQTELTEIEGIGEKTATKLLSHFGSVASIRAASETEIEKIAGKKVASLLQNYFSQSQTNNETD